MGNCCCFFSRDSPPGAVEETAKLVLHDGELQEFAHPVKVSYLLKAHPECFICDSEEMEFNDVVRAVSENDVLRPGQLYFALPVDRLNRPLKAEEMASLAVKASSLIFARSGGGKGLGFRRKKFVLFPGGEENGKSFRRVVPEIGGGSAVAVVDGLKRGRSGRGGGGGTGKFAVVLNSIPE